MKYAFALFAALAFALAGCQSTGTFKTIRAVGLTVDSASMAWADYVVAGERTADTRDDVSPADQARVKEIHDKFFDSYNYAIDVARLDKNAPPPAELTILALNLINLIAELKK